MSGNWEIADGDLKGESWCETSEEDPDEQHCDACSELRPGGRRWFRQPEGTSLEDVGVRHLQLIGLTQCFDQTTPRTAEYSKPPGNRGRWQKQVLDPDFDWIGGTEAETAAPQRETDVRPLRLVLRVSGRSPGRRSRPVLQGFLLPERARICPTHWAGWLPSSPETRRHPDIYRGHPRSTRTRV